MSLPEPGTMMTIPRGARLLRVAASGSRITTQTMRFEDGGVAGAGVEMLFIGRAKGGAYALFRNPDFTMVAVAAAAFKEKRRVRSKEK